MQRPLAAQFEALVFIPAEQNKRQLKLDQLGRGQMRGQHKNGNE